MAQLHERAIMVVPDSVQPGEEAEEGKGPDPTVERTPLMLLLDQPLHELPWEGVPLLRGQPVCRLPSADFVSSCARAAETLSQHEGGVDSSNAFFVLNPGGDLRRTQKTFESTFARSPWEGTVGEAPGADALCAKLEQKDLFIYCGHGDGSRYIAGEQLQRLPRCAVSLLMGCSSGALRPHGTLAPSGMALSYLHAHCPALVANLWDVTDGEIDRFCGALVESCTAGGSLLKAMARARRACRLEFLTGLAAVCYGVPIETTPRNPPR